MLLFWHNIMLLLKRNSILVVARNHKLVLKHMPTPAEKLAQALEVLHDLQEKGIVAVNMDGNA